MLQSPEDRRKFIRLEMPIEVDYISKTSGLLKKTISKDISAEGLRFLTNSPIEKDESLELRLILPEARNPVHIIGKTAWIKKFSLDENSLEVGVEFIKIEEDNKNTFLKFLCDLIYNLPKEIKHADKII